jgi:hypothetical protein
MNLHENFRISWESTILGLEQIYPRGASGRVTSDERPEMSDEWQTDE